MGSLHYCFAASVQLKFMLLIGIAIYDQYSLFTKFLPCENLRRGIDDCSPWNFVIDDVDLRVAATEG